MPARVTRLNGTETAVLAVLVSRGSLRAIDLAKASTKRGIYSQLIRMRDKGLILRGRDMRYVASQSGINALNALKRSLATC